MSMSFTLAREQVERLLAGFDSISMELDEVKSALTESDNAKQLPQKDGREMSVPDIDGIRWKVKGGVYASP